MEKYHHICLYSSLNGLNIRPTDCSRTFDHQIKSLDHAGDMMNKFIKCGLDLFEIILCLDVRGISNLREHFLRDTLDRLRPTENIWDIRRLERLVADRQETLNKN